ncbi:CidA/LrgA family protein [Microbulbifer sp. SAOS-129_SWC]|uniref:CidA/LrgA family protein n=1 Tax=Microbulbifer sp. SAOS-129_SWC TaxID=3145235 RepID=UPI003217F16F
MRLSSLHQPLRSAGHWLAGAAALCACNLLGQKISDALALPVPGSVVGMLILLIALMLYGGIPRGVGMVSGQLLRLLALLFLPAAVGIYFVRDLSARDWLGLLAATTVGTLLSLTLCALLLKKLLGTEGGERDD